MHPLTDDVRAGVGVDSGFLEGLVRERALVVDPDFGHLEQVAEWLYTRDLGPDPGGGTTDGKYINWLTISDNAKSVVEDVERIRSNSMVPLDIPIYGYIYDCKTGELVEIPEATAAGKAD